LRQKYPKNSKSDVEYYLQNAKAKNEQKRSSKSEDKNQSWASQF
jgi:hypothetical protein